MRRTCDWQQLSRPTLLTSSSSSAPAKTPGRRFHCEKRNSETNLMISNLNHVLKYANKTDGN